jgi:hypothetical protein
MIYGASMIRILAMIGENVLRTGRIIRRHFRRFRAKSFFALIWNSVVLLKKGGLYEDSR